MADMATLKLHDPSLLCTKALIDGRWIGDGHTPVNNPATGEIIAHVPDLGAAETTQAVEAAERAFPAWSKRLAKERANLMRRWFDLIIANRDDLALILTSEQG